MDPKYLVNGDVAPLVNGVPQPDGKIDVAARTDDSEEVRWVDKLGQHIDHGCCDCFHG